MQHATSPVPSISQVSPGHEDGPAERACTRLSPSLMFVDPPGQADCWVDVCQGLLDAGQTKITIRVLDDVLAPIAEQLIERFGDRVVRIDGPNGGRHDVADGSAGRDTDAILLLGGSADGVSAALMDYVDDMTVTVVAPVTERFWNRLPLYLISIPKAGTHLLFQLAEALGYRPGGPSPASPMGGYWYYLLNTNAHTSAHEFFLDATQKAPFGNRAHPFLRAPALFNYRHPLDILASEASYFHLDGKSPLSVLLSPLSFDERAMLLADDHWLAGSIRDRLGRFLPWLGCTNVIPVSFEEMVGTAGGGSDTVLERLIWSLQLKLHVPGHPRSFRSGIQREASPTFREGVIGGWKDKLPKAAVQHVRELPQDFMAAFGYELDAGGDAQPAHAEARRRRSLVLSRAEFAQIPILVATNVLGHNIVAFQKCFFAIPATAGELDLATLSEDELTQFPRANTQAEIFAALIRQSAEDAARASEADAPEPVVLEPIDDFIITAQTGRVVAIRRDCGALDPALDDAAIRERYAPDDVIIEQRRADIAAVIALRKADRSERTLAALREEFAATPDTTRTLVHDELQALLAVWPDRMRAMVREELQTVLAAWPGTMRSLVRDELQVLLAAWPDAMRALVRDEFQAVLAQERNATVRSGGGFLGYNIFRRLDDTIAVPRRLGAIDPIDPALGDLPGVIVAHSAHAARLSIVWRWIRWAYWDGARS